MIHYKMYVITILLAAICFTMGAGFYLLCESIVQLFARVFNILAQIEGLCDIIVNTASFVGEYAIIICPRESRCESCCECQ